MEIRAAYCAVCDRKVRVMVEPGSLPGSGPADDPYAGVVCLEHGAGCTGAMCPVFDVPTERMRASLDAYRSLAGGG